MAQQTVKMKQVARSLVWLRKKTEKDPACEPDAKWRKTDPAGTGTVRDGPRRTL